MNTNHTIRIAVRASALTAVLAGLLLGAPAIAFAGPSTTPAPAPPGVNDRANQSCVACTALEPQQPGLGSPELTSSNSGQVTDGAGSQTPLILNGDRFTPGKSDVHYIVVRNGVIACDGHWQANQDGTLAAITACGTSQRAGAVNGYAYVIDTSTGQQTNHLPVQVL